MLQIFEVVDFVFENVKICRAFLFGGGEVEVGVISAFDGGRAEDFAFVGEDFAEDVHGHGENGLVGDVSGEEIEAGLAAHRAEVDDVVADVGIADEGGEHMLDGVHGTVVHVIAGVGRAGAEVVGGDIPVNAGDINTGGQCIVIDSKAGDSFHQNISFLCRSNT